MTTKDWIYISKDGKEIKSSLGYVAADGTVRIAGRPNQWIPVVLGGQCAALGLDPKRVSETASPAECLARVGENPGGITVTTGTQRAEAKAAALEVAIPGVTEILRLREEVGVAADKDDYQSRHAMDRESGLRFPGPEDTAPAARLADLTAANPRAALYLEATRRANRGGGSDYRAAQAAELLEQGGAIEEAQALLSQDASYTD